MSCWVVAAGPVGPAGTWRVGVREGQQAPSKEKGLPTGAAMCGKCLKSLTPAPSLHEKAVPVIRDLPHCRSLMGIDEYWTACIGHTWHHKVGVDTHQDPHPPYTQRVLGVPQGPGGGGLTSFENPMCQCKNMQRQKASGAPEHRLSIVARAATPLETCFQKNAKKCNVYV